MAGCRTAPVGEESPEVVGLHLVHDIRITLGVAPPFVVGDGSASLVDDDQPQAALPACGDQGFGHAFDVVVVDGPFAVDGTKEP